MALFNYAKTYAEISGQITSNPTNPEDWLKIFIAPSIDNAGNAGKDPKGSGHLITHGIDLLADYSNRVRGFVPNNTYTATSSYFRGDGWAKYWNLTDEDEAAGTGLNANTNRATYLSQTLVSAADIKNWINASYTSQRAMRYKGIINIDDNGKIISSTTNPDGFPDKCEVGDTYKVVLKGASSGKIGGDVVYTGDLVICIQAGTGSLLNNKEYWTVVQDNVEYRVLGTINNSSIYFYTANQVSDFTIYAPTSGGKTKQVLLSTGATPEWANQSDLVAGSVLGSLNAGLGITYHTSQNLSYSKFNGSTELTIAVNIAQLAEIGKDVNPYLGIVAVDAGKHSSLYGKNDKTAKPTISITDGEIYLTPENIKNALGYVPGDSLVGIKKITLGNGKDVGNTNQENPYILIISENNTILAKYLTVGNEGITVASNGGILGIALNAAKTDDLGGIKIYLNDAEYTVAATTSPALTANITNKTNDFVGLQTDKNNTAFVYVPWDHLFTEKNKTRGLVEALTDENSKTDNNPNVTTTKTFLLGSDGKWYNLPGSAFIGTWRPILLGGNALLDNSAVPEKAHTLNFSAPSNDNANKTTLSYVKDDTNKVTTINIASSWRPILADGTPIGVNDSLNISSSGSIAVAKVDGDNKNTEQWDMTMGLVWWNISSNKAEYVW